MIDLKDKNLSRAESAYQRLRTGIRSGEFHPGQRLLERDLASRLKVSRTPVREAIQRLASEGLIEVTKGRGVSVVELDRKKVRELYYLRELLEGAAAELAAQHASAGDLQSLEDLLERSFAAKARRDCARMNQLFHQAIYEAGQNQYLRQALDQLSDSLALLPGTTFDVPGRIAKAREEHRAIFAAIKERSPAKAGAAARKHIQLAGATRISMMFES